MSLVLYISSGLQESERCTCLQFIHPKTNMCKRKTAETASQVRPSTSLAHVVILAIRFYPECCSVRRCLCSAKCMVKLKVTVVTCMKSVFCDALCQTWFLWGQMNLFSNVVFFVFRSVTGVVVHVLQSLQAKMFGQQWIVFNHTTSGLGQCDEQKHRSKLKTHAVRIRAMNLVRLFFGTTTLREELSCMIPGHCSGVFNCLILEHLIPLTRQWPVLSSHHCHCPSIARLL